MRRTHIVAVLAGLLWVMGGCGSQVDESLLPTRVPTLGPDFFAVTPTQPPTPTPLAAAVTATLEPTAAAETPAPAETEAVTATEPLTATVEATVEAPAEATETPAPAEAETVTATVEPTVAPTVAGGETLTATQEITATSQVTSAEEAATPEAAEADPYAGLPEDLKAAMAEADPARGQQLTLQNGCVGCHSLDPNQPMAGPTWHNLAETAATRMPGRTAAFYLYDSIVNPNDYIVEGYPPNLMIQTFAETISTQDLADIIAYLLTLKDQ